MNNNNNIKVAVGMSGGVDSSVAALLLKKQGYAVVGLFMKLWHDPCGVGQNACCDEHALADAQKVAAKIGILFYIVDVRKEFKEAVTDYFIDDYKNCRTPNPCVMCNKMIKFGWLMDFAEKIGCDYLATGHYARIENSSNLSIINFQCSLNDHLSNEQINDKCSMENGKFHLLRGKDEKKDQSYFLYRLNQDQLSRIIFPLGEMTKDEVRKIAKDNDLPVHEKKESQEVCFVEDDYRDFLKRNLGESAFKPGDIVDTEGNIVGRHEGLINYTIGQRRNVNQELRIMNQGENRTPLYVIGFHKEKNLLIAGEDKELFKKEFAVENVSWIDPQTESRIKNQESRDITVKIRYKAEEVPCSIYLCHPELDSGSKMPKQVRHDSLKIQLSKPVRAVTAGQSAVFYSGDEVIGGGIIAS